ncbi:hypothetical protein EDC15_102226 [Acetobacter aceti NBRC 14818]|nr:hypothetical protein EDC15_102226 [Acetobacter aceti NBRC 14818]
MTRIFLNDEVSPTLFIMIYVVFLVRLSSVVENRDLRVWRGMHPVLLLPLLDGEAYARFC